MTVRRSASASLDCEQGFLTIATECLGEVRRNQADAARGNAEAVHRMRIAITRLLAVRRFFSSVVTDADWRSVEPELAWLQRKLGKVRDDDVLVTTADRFGSGRPGQKRRRSPARRTLKHRAQLATALASHRYKHLLAAITNWIDAGPWRSKDGKADMRDAALSRYATQRLDRWSARMSRRIGCRSKALHRIRIDAKHFRYMGEALAKFGIDLSKKHLRMQSAAGRIQQTLGNLRDFERAKGSTGQSNASFAERRRKLWRKAQKALRSLRN